MPKGIPKHTQELSTQKAEIENTKDEINLDLLCALRDEIKRRLADGGFKDAKLTTLLKEYRGLLNATKAPNQVNIATGNLIDRSDRRSLELREQVMDPAKADRLREKALEQINRERG